MSDNETGAAENPTFAVLAAHPSAIAPAVQEAKAEIESVMGTPLYTADLRRQYGDIIRGELAGAGGPIGPEAGPDPDLPIHFSRYDISEAPGSYRIRGEDRTLIDSFFPVAHEAGMGRAKVSAVIGWAMGRQNGHNLRNDFTAWAIGQGWSDHHIQSALKWYGGYRASPSSSERSAAPVASPVADRKSQIESMMYVGGKPNPAYFDDETIRAEYRRLIAAG